MLIFQLCALAAVWHFIGFGAVMSIIGIIVGMVLIMAVAQ